MTTIESFSTKLKKLREEKGLNQSELGEALGVSRGSISFYEKAERIPDIDFLVKTAKFFDVPVDYLLGLSTVSEKDVDTDLKAVSDYIGLDFQIVEMLHFSTLGRKRDNTGKPKEDDFILFIKEFLGDYSEFLNTDVWAYDSDNIPSLALHYLYLLQDYNSFLDYRFEQKGFSLDEIPADNVDKYLLHLYEMKSLSDEKCKVIDEAYKNIFESLKRLIENYCFNERAKSFCSKQKIEKYINLLYCVKEGKEITDELLFNLDLI
ncbi:MAG: helix-turn-helix domain-containing protein [Clostridia bacterium]|nr:helix-turn-helix domain-containing protein [Clostridia bacterium]